MLVLKIELHSAITGKVSTLYEAVITNVGGTQRKGNYKFLAYRKGLRAVKSLKAREAPVRESRVYDHPRLSAHVWTLVRKCLQNANY